MVKDINYATGLLYGIIFQKGSLKLLKQAGLLGVYVDDYKSKKRYKDCIFFHFKMEFNYIRNTKEGPKVDKFIESITDFKTFYDFYETGEGWMLVFKFNPIFRKDVALFKEGRFGEFSEAFREIVYSGNLSSQRIDLAKEIFRYQES